MAPNSPAARVLARRLLASAAPAPTDETAAEVALPAAERVVLHLATELSRWFGPYGFHALLTRAVAEARAEHPALRHVRVGEPTAPTLHGLAAASGTHGADETVEGVEAALAALVDLLGRLIGEDLAVTFIDRTIVAVAPDAASEATSRTDSTIQPSLERPS